jgi:eukaryotic-like serine/threonine-protein kinase
LPPRFLLLFGLALAGLLLAGCSRGPAQTWPGLNADSQYAYVAQGQQVHAVNLADGKQIWAFPTAANNNISQIVSQPGVGADVIVVGSEGPTSSYSGIAYGLDRNTGTQKWCLAFDQKGASSQNCPLAQGAPSAGIFGIAPAVDDRILGGVTVTDGKAYFGLASGKVYAVDAETGKDLWYFQAERDVWAAPLVVSNTVYVTSLDHHVYALDSESGGLKWKQDLGAAVAGEASFDQGLVFVGTFGNRMAALDAGTGEERWSFTTKNWVWNGPAVGKGVLYLTDVSGNVFAVDEAAGQQIWTVKPGGEMRARPTLAGDTLYVGDHDGHMFALNVADGSDRWPASTIKGQLLVSPVVVSDTVLVAPYTGDNLLEAYSPTGTLIWPFNPSK